MGHEWVRDALQARGKTQRELAQAWAISEGAVSRWMAGTESKDMPLSRAVSLSRMLGMDLEELAKRLGFLGPQSATPAEILPPSRADGIPLGTVLPVPIGSGRMRVLIHLDVPAEVAGDLVKLLGQAM
jgi:hypothetical protein